MLRLPADGPRCSVSSQAGEYTTHWGFGRLHCAETARYSVVSPALGQRTSHLPPERPIFYLWLWNSPASREAYDRHIAEWTARQRQPPPPAEDAPPSAKLLIFELIAAYWTAAELHYRKTDGSPTGELQPLRDALRLLRKLCGSTAAEEFGPLKLHACREEMIRRDWARSTINSQTKRIVRLFRWAVSRELLPPAIPSALRELPGLERGRTAARETKPVEPLADAHFQATLPHLPPLVADLLRLQRLTGMRPNEVCQLRPGDLDRTGEIWLYTPRTHKTSHRGRARIIAIGPKAQQLLRPYLLRGADELCFSPAGSERQRRREQHERRKTPLHYGNRGHPLLGLALAEKHLLAVDPTWLASGGHPQQHGTGMAGFALYGCLTDLLNSPEAISLQHRLESVKILPDHGRHDPDLYGDVTAQLCPGLKLLLPNASGAPSP